MVVFKNVSGMSSQKRYATRLREAEEFWAGILPADAAYWIVEWEKHVVAKTMADAGFSRADIGRALGVSPPRASSFLMCYAHPAEIVQGWRARRDIRANLQNTA